jgi:signal peptidase I
METKAKSFRLPASVRAALIGRRPKRTLARIVVLVVAILLARSYLVLPIHVKGTSMLPTYQDGGVNFVNRLAYLRSEPKRGDVVGIRLAGQSVMYMKRVVGLPGDIVAFHKGRLLIDGELVEEPYLNPGCDWEIPPETLGPGLYYVVGDNRSMPEEFHEKGKTPKQRIIGKVLL